jgi:hypothetical protein
MVARIHAAPPQGIEAMTPRSALLAFLFLPALAPAQAPALPPDQLGMGKMWTFENPPLAYLEKEYGFKPDQKWLDSLRLASLRLGERQNPWCSASFVSPKGLVMTNHHCVREKMAELEGDKDLLADGFVARSLADEVKLDGLTVQQLVSQKDVTAQVNEGVGEGDDDAAVANKRAVNAAKVVAEADAANGDELHEVVTLYQGAQHFLYTYRIWDDIRLVMAPQLAVPHFGGDPDNFTFPRWSIDFAFVRAWHDDKPADTSANWFRWRQGGARENELVFVPGNPGHTDRLLTHAQMESLRDAEYPITLEQLDHSLKVLHGYAEAEPEAGKDLLPTILSWENSRKAYEGMLAGLRNPELMRLRLLKEQRFRAAVDADPALKAKFGDLWDKLAEVAVKKRELQARSMFHDPSYSPVLERAVLVARAVDPAREQDDREQDALEAVAMPMEGNAITMSLLADHFVRARRWLPKDDPFLKLVLGELEVPAAIARLGRSKLADDKFTKELIESGADAVSKSDDPGVAAGAALWPLMREAARQQKELDAREKVLGTRMGLALFAVYGTQVAPDATMTLRFSDGRVQGYPYNGTLAPWATSFYGLYARSTEFGNQKPWELAKVWLDAQDKVDMTAKVCFASTNDIIGGNSGSVVVDQALQVVGLIFDGNIESLSNNFWYLQDSSRAVSVHTDAITMALKVYGAGRVSEELSAGWKDAGK